MIVLEKEVKEKNKISLVLKISLIVSFLLVIAGIIIGVTLINRKSDNKFKEPLKEVINQTENVVEYEQETNVIANEIIEQEESEKNELVKKPKEEVKQPEKKEEVPVDSAKDNSEQKNEEIPADSVKEDSEQNKEQVDKEETIKFEQHYVKSINISYPNDWFVTNQGVTSIIKNINIKDSYIAVYKEHYTENDLTYFDDWYPEATSIERRIINGQEWLFVVTEKGTTVTTQMIAIKENWCYNVEVVIKEGINKETINKIINTITIP